VATNLLVLEGIVHKTPRRTQSPSGVPHWHFSLEHRSQQFEAELSRNAFVRIQVVASGLAIEQFTQDLYQGCHVCVSGFLSRHETKDGIGKLVLHAQKIERMN
jgi:primosomal replication protein N